VLTQQALSDTSTNATFNSAFNEVVNGGSSFQTNSTTASGGFNLFVVAGGGGTSLASPSDQFTYT
jgi:hypothetical protein